MSSDPEKVVSDIKSLVDKVKSVKVVTDFGISVESKISKTKEEAINRADYESYMKTSKLKEGDINKSIDNIVNNMLNDLLGGNK